MADTSIFSFRLPNDLREKLEQDANSNGRSLSNLIIWILRNYINNKSK